MKNFAFVFPGQGSQAVGMLDGWGGHPAVAQALQEASDALGEDVGRLIQEGPKEALALTTNTQPVMLVAGVAAWRVWRAEGGALPAAVAGHSLGEYSALVASGVLTLAQAAPLVRLRAAPSSVVAVPMTWWPRAANSNAMAACNRTPTPSATPCTARLLAPCAGWSVCRPSRAGASPISSSAAPARCWPA